MRGPAAPGDVTRAFSPSRWPRLVLLYCMICPPAAALCYLAFLPMWEGRPLLALGSAALSMALLSAGILLLDEPGQRGSASMLIAASVLLGSGLAQHLASGPAAADLGTRKPGRDNPRGVGDVPLPEFAA